MPKFDEMQRNEKSQGGGVTIKIKVKNFKIFAPLFFFCLFLIFELNWKQTVAVFTTYLRSFPRYECLKDVSRTSCLLSYFKRYEYVIVIARYRIQNLESRLF